jgi:hypothetical protein
MRRSLIFPAAALTTTLVFGCGDQQSPMAPADMSPSAVAEVFGYQIFHPVDAEVFISCANDGLGEVVHSTGLALETFHITQAATGQTMIQFRLQSIHIVGVGETSGKTYNLVGGSFPHQWGTSLFDASGQTTFGEEVSAIIVERGKGEIGTFRYLFHVTVNANGDAVSTVDHFEADCFPA